MTLHPFMQLKVGKDPGSKEYITTIPPERLTGMEYKNSTSAIPTFQFTAVDPTFKVLEDQLLLSDDTAEPIYMRFGYLHGDRQVTREWVRGYMINYVPKITAKGMEIIANFTAMKDDGLVKVVPQQFSGRISSVVEKIAERLDMTPEVEETNDDESEAHEDFEGGPRQWATGTLTLVKYIRKELLPLARSKSNSGAYDLFVTSEKGGKSILHFHTPGYLGCARRAVEELSLRYLAGHDDVIQEFSPNFESKALGSYGARSLVTDSFDTDTGQNRAKVDNSIATKMAALSIGVEIVPLNEEDPESESESHGRVPDHGDAADVEAKAINRWDSLHAASMTAGMTLIGFPEFVNLDPFDYMNITVLLPYLGGWREHWSGGRWLIEEVLHQIGSAYSIQAQLRRMSPARLGSET